MCSLLDVRSEDANQSFSAAVQLHDGLVKAWALWGDYLDQLFAKDRCVCVCVCVRVWGCVSERESVM